MGPGSIIAVTLVFTLVVIGVVVFVMRKAGAFGPSKAKQELAARLVQTGSKGRAMILSIQPTGMVVNHINLQCKLRFRIEPLQGGVPFEGEKTVLMPQTSMPRIGDVWPCWYDSIDHTQFAVGQPNEISAEQITVFREFGIPHPLDREWPRP